MYMIFQHKNNLIKEISKLIYTITSNLKIFRIEVNYTYIIEIILFDYKNDFSEAKSIILTRHCPNSSIIIR